VLADYFEIKPISDADIQPNRAYIPRKTKDSSAWFNCLKNYVKLVLPKARPRPVRKTSHGPKLQGVLGSKDSYEWCSKSPTNLLFAIFNRQMKSKLSPDLEVLKEFKTWFEGWFDSKFEKIVGEPEIKPWQEWISENTTWDAEKKRKYTETFIKQTNASVFKSEDWRYAFSAMVKSGEVYFRNVTHRDQYNCLLDRDDRPRLIFVPSKNACGPITWIQQFMFKDLKAVVPGFIQAMNSNELKQVIRTHIPANSKCCSSDGSSFDSHQHLELMEIVDSYVWNKFASRIEKVCQAHFEHPKVMLEGLLWQAHQHDAKLFFQLPGVEEHFGSRFSANQQARQYFPVAGQDWMDIDIRGTTFSGQPVKTTLGNTIRSLAYHEFICYKAGIPDSDKFVIASGDDVCCWIEETRVKDYKKSLFELTHTKTDEVSKGLGQCIKELKISEWWDMDFCSKKCFYKDGKWIICRDGSKIWKEKMEYVGKLETFHREPERHVMAMADSAASELKSDLIQEFFGHRLTRIRENLNREMNDAVLYGEKDRRRIGLLRERVERIDQWIAKDTVLDAWRGDNVDQMVSASKRRSWIEGEELPREADWSFFTEAGWDLFSFTQYFGGDEEVSLV